LKRIWAWWMFFKAVSITKIEKEVVSKGRMSPS
jgi:hypothetical protein